MKLEEPEELWLPVFQTFEKFPDYKACLMLFQSLQVENSLSQLSEGAMVDTVKLVSSVAHLAQRVTGKSLVRMYC